MMPVIAHTNKKFSRMCFEKSKVALAEYKKKNKIKMVVSKHLTHFCYPIGLVLYQHLNSHVAYPGIPPENSNHSASRETLLSGEFLFLENPLSSERVLSDFDQSNLRRGYDGKC